MASQRQTRVTLSKLEYKPQATPNGKQTPQFWGPPVIAKAYKMQSLLSPLASQNIMALSLV